MHGTLRYWNRVVLETATLKVCVLVAGYGRGPLSSKPMPAPKQKKASCRRYPLLSRFKDGTAGLAHRTE